LFVNLWLLDKSSGHRTSNVRIREEYICVLEIGRIMKAEIKTGDSRLQVKCVTILLVGMKCAAEMKE